MKKFFFALTSALLILTSITSTVAAKDVWLATNSDGSEWYILTETIDGDAHGKFRWTNAETKLVEKDGSVIGVSWKFTQVTPDDGRLANWVYSTVWDNHPYAETEVLPGTNVEKILRYCLNHLGI